MREKVRESANTLVMPVFILISHYLHLAWKGREKEGGMKFSYSFLFVHIDKNAGFHASTYGVNGNSVLCPLKVNTTQRDTFSIMKEPQRPRYFYIFLRPFSKTNLKLFANSILLISVRLHRNTKK